MSSLIKSDEELRAREKTASKFDPMTLQQFLALLSVEEVSRLHTLLENVEGDMLKEFAILVDIELWGR